jgi:hypothetical protein
MSNQGLKLEGSAPDAYHGDELPHEIQGDAVAVEIREQAFDRFARLSDEESMTLDLYGPGTDYLISLSEKLGLDPHMVKNKLEACFFASPAAYRQSSAPLDEIWPVVPVCAAGIAPPFDAKEHCSSVPKGPGLEARMRCQMDHHPVPIPHSLER